jgi:aspartyl-tRNA(Asn)/glutamyl-tRNA(Gln) amidotransferase subunit C
MTQVDVRALAKLARLEVSDEELARLEKEIPAILAFVEQIQEVSAAALPESPEHRNVMRDDANAHEGGLYTEELLKSAPASRDNQVVVKQVISKKK